MAARKLAAYVHVGGRVFAPGDTPPKEFADQITNPAAWGDTSADEKGSGGTSDSGSKGYGDLTVDELNAEVEKRNEGRDQAIEVTGTGKDGNVLKSDLVDALKADDESTE